MEMIEIRKALKVSNHSCGHL